MSKHRSYCGFVFFGDFHLLFGLRGLRFEAFDCAFDGLSVFIIDVARYAGGKNGIYVEFDKRQRRYNAIRKRKGGFDMTDSNTEITFNSIKDLVYYLNHIDKDDNGLQVNIKIQSTKGSETDGRN